MTSGRIPASAGGVSAVEIAKEAARLAAIRMREGFGKTSVSRTKGERSVVTAVDEAVEREVTGLIRDTFPDHAILAEEDAAQTRADGWMWVIDPLDGTKNFSRGIPHFCFSIALCFDSEPVLGLIQQPLLDEQYLAIKGEGVTLNGQRAGVTSVETVAEAVISIDLGFDAARGSAQLDIARETWPNVQGIRTMSSAALGLAYVAVGRWDLYVHASLEPWDSAAGILLVREGGGLVTTPAGEPATIFSPAVIAGTPRVHADFLARRAASSTS
jgi:myo-inositol-1(or 4)-monophosphatase